MSAIYDEQAVVSHAARSHAAALQRTDDALRVLYMCYASLNDPLLWTQVVGYLDGLATRGHQMMLVTFEPPAKETRLKQVREQLNSRGIAWHRMHYHKQPSLPATMFDVAAGAMAATRLVRRHNLDAIHARNHVSAAMALMACKLTGCRMIFDLRGLMADEYVDAGRWKRGGAAYRITDWVQRRALRRADGVTVRTNAVRRYLGQDLSSTRSDVIPACVNVDQIGGRSHERDRMREQLGVSGRPVMVYVGKFTGWYMEKEMADFFSVARRSGLDLFFMVVTQADPSPMLKELERNGISQRDYRVLQAPPDELGRYLAACDFGISFIRPCQSKMSSSPTKIGEYLAARLPVLSSSGIGDVDELLRDNRVGVLVDDFSVQSYEDAERAIGELYRDPDTRARCRAVAHTHLSLAGVGVPRYDRLYRGLADRCAS